MAGCNSGWWRISQSIKSITSNRGMRQGYKYKYLSVICCRLMGCDLYLITVTETGTKLLSDTGKMVYNTDS